MFPGVVGFGVLSRLLAVGLGVLCWGLVALPPAALAQQGGVDLTVSATLDKDSYLAGEQVTVTMRVRNDGDGWADGVYVRPTGNTYVADWEMGGFREGSGEYLGPGEEKSVTFSFEMLSLTRPVIELTVGFPGADLDPANDRFVLDIPAVLGNVDGVLYGDKDLDRVVDPGEGLSGVELSLQHEFGPFDGMVVRSGANGRFVMPEAVAGKYSLYAGLPPGWKLDTAPDPAYLHVAPGANTPVLRAVRVVKPPLTASIRFDRATYAVGDVIREHVRLTNTGRADLTGITALCTGMGNENELYGRGWGDLEAYSGAGVPLRAGETREFDFTEVVPQGGFDYGRVQIDCWFATDGDHFSGVRAGTSAAVPGGRGGYGGILHLDLDRDGYQDGEGLRDVKVYLVGSDGTIAARDVTDAGGRFMFADVPAARYELRFVGPWRFIDHSAEFLQVRAGMSQDYMRFGVLPGASQPDPDAPPPAEPGLPPSAGPAPQGKASVPSHLADTGASVRELAGFGFGLLLVGCWLLFLPTRRES